MSMMTEAPCTPGYPSRLASCHFRIGMAVEGGTGATVGGGHGRRIVPWPDMHTGLGAVADCRCFPSWFAPIPHPQNEF